ncbi:sulfatase-like hydrolase/transferase [Natrarchaeobius sp. A-rgal3]|uniref:sulfatase-like hydrolase/transferase n=1 Tax=Natrarchaeobius versutus TaxID=1679078 RepID=UPI00350EAFDB
MDNHIVGVKINRGMSQPNILMVILDSTRAKNMSLYGYDRETTPFLESFSERATCYTQARSPGIHSIASHVSMFTGYEVEEHKSTEHPSQIDVTKTIWKELSDEFGYKTGLFTPNAVIARASNIPNCFDYNYSPWADKLFGQKRLFEGVYSPKDDEEYTGTV